MKLVNNYNKKNSKLARKIIVAIKGLSASIGGLTILQDKPYVLCGVLVVGFLATEAITFLSSDEE